MVLNANADENFWWLLGPGIAQVWGTLAITTDDGVWEGNFTGDFVFDPELSEWNPQLFSSVNLHGPDGRKLKAECDETSAESEIVACVGTIHSPHG